MRGREQGWGGAVGAKWEVAKVSGSICCAAAFPESMTPKASLTYSHH